MSKRPKLPKDQQALWGKVTDTVDPLRERPSAPDLPPRKYFEKPFSDRALPAEWGDGAGLTSPEPQLDRKDHRRLTQGRLMIDRTIDLHGSTQDQAFARLKGQVETCVRHDNRVILVVTGKGGRRWNQTDDDCVGQRKREDFDQFGGVLRRMLPLWLNGPELSPFIHSYGPAAKEHGGEGALYVRLKRHKVKRDKR